VPSWSLSLLRSSICLEARRGRTWEVCEYESTGQFGALTEPPLHIFLSNLKINFVFSFGGGMLVVFIALMVIVPAAGLVFVRSEHSDQENDPVTGGSLVPKKDGGGMKIFRKLYYGAWGLLIFIPTLYKMGRTLVALTSRNAGSKSPFFTRE